MPCYITGTREGDLELETQENYREILLLTRLLCEACKILDSKDYLKRKMSPRLRGWANRHKRKDAHKEVCK